MSRRLRAAALLVAGRAACATAGAQAPPSAAVDSIFAPFARPDSPGCAVGVYRAGEILFAKGYGMASIEHGGAITPRTPFNVASLSKQFTGRVGGPGMVAAMYRPAPLLTGDSTEYASGIGVGQYRGLPMVSHTGGAGGDYVLVRFPRQRLTTVVPCNFEGGDAWGRSLRVAALFLGDALAREPDAPAAGRVTLPDSVLARYVGEYRHPTDVEQRLRIEVRDGTLGALVNGVFYGAVPTGPRSFRDSPLTFAVRDGRLMVRRPRFPERALATADRDGFRLDTDRVSDLAFTRLPEPSR